MDLYCSLIGIIAIIKAIDVSEYKEEFFYGKQG